MMDFISDPVSRTGIGNYRLLEVSIANTFDIL